MKFIFVLLSLILSSHVALACTESTIKSITKSIDPYYPARVATQVETALKALNLCDENLYSAGFNISVKFEPYYTGSTQVMAKAIIAHRKSMQSELAHGIVMGLIQEIDLYYQESTYYILEAILRLAEIHSENAKNYAFELLKMQDPLYSRSNTWLLQTVDALQSIAAKPVPGQGGSPIWAFRSDNAPCDGVHGPWGYYELCPRYYASVADQFGNRLVLACKAESAGIEFRVTFGRESWNKINRTSIENLAFGTSGTMQSLGVPYIVHQASTLFASEPLAYEVLTELRNANKLTVNVRSNSGEINTKLNFSLKGSNVAIGQLMQACR